MAYHLAGFGAQVVITARREKVLQQVVEKCQVLGAQKALYVAADMANPSDPERVVKFAVDKLGGLDYLVLNHIGPSPFAIPFVAPYTSTKFALNGFFGTLQHELAMQRSNVSITICILGLIDTDSAMEKVKGITNIQAWPASEAALHIITSGATQQTESYYPWFWYYGTLIRDWFPYFRDISIRYFYKY
ncbi:unnamed protein product [Coregonus sp. 'balchen']|nr:unnamed protein product [Coregonus sp. 'balchen']